MELCVSKCTFESTSPNAAKRRTVSNKLMMNILLNLLLIINTTTFIVAKPKLFPKFNYTSSKSELITNEIFKTKSSILIVGHIGCPPLMQFIRDAQEANINKQFQLIYILENTNSQINQFNSTEENTWSRTRNYFKIEPMNEIIIGECNNEKLITTKDKIIIKSQCRKLSKKLKTKSSPTIYFVNEKGEITKYLKGYYSGMTSKERMDKLINE